MVFFLFVSNLASSDGQGRSDSRMASVDAVRVESAEASRVHESEAKATTAVESLVLAREELAIEGTPSSICDTPSAAHEGCVPVEEPGSEVLATGSRSEWAGNAVVSGSSVVVTSAPTAGVLDEEVSPRPGGSMGGVEQMGRAVWHARSRTGWQEQCNGTTSATRCCCA